MFGFSFVEILIIGIIALIFIGPQQLPQVARTIAKFINEMKRSVGEVQRSIVVEQMNKKNSKENPEVNKMDLHPSHQNQSSTESTKEETHKPSGDQS